MIGNALHFAIAKTLRDRLRPNWQWAQIEDGKVRDNRTAVQLKELGAPSGWPDFALTPPAGQIHCLKLERAGEPVKYKYAKTNDELIAAKDNFRFECTRTATPYAIAHNFNEALVVLDAWGCLTDGGSYDSRNRHWHTRRPGASHT